MTPPMQLQSQLAGPQMCSGTSRAALAVAIAAKGVEAVGGPDQVRHARSVYTEVSSRTCEIFTKSVKRSSEIFVT